MNVETVPYASPEAIIRLQVTLRENFVPVLKSFIGNTKVYISDIIYALQENRIKDAQDIAHKLYSSAAQFGLHDFAKSVKELEYADPHDRTTLNVLCRQIEFKGHEAIIYLQNYITAS